MAEAWLEEEEEELREIRDSAANRRHRRSNLNQATERPERNKPEHRFPGQGPLSSIRAVIKRTSRTSTQSEQQRDRRRPEITIVAAEPIGPGSWFHGGPTGGLGFPPPPPPQWRPSEFHPAELPPSYDQVIKEINQVPVPPPNANAEPRRTTTCATQTDFQVEDNLNEANSNVIVQPPHCQEQLAPAQRPPELSRQPLSFVANNVKDSASQIAVGKPAETSTRQQDTNVSRQPVPRPRTKSNLKQAPNHNLSIFQSNSEDVFWAQSETPSGFADNFVGDINNMSQNSIASRIKAFESQTENSDQARRPEIAPRSINTKDSIVGRPVPPPKPASNRTSGEWDPSKDHKPKFTPREGLVPPRPQDQVGTTKPELPKKPKPNLVKSNSSDFEAALFLNNGNESERKVPVPAPRPLLPKKPSQMEAPTTVSSGPRPPVLVPKLSVATPAKAFTVAETPVARLPPPPTPSKPLVEMDLISFDDDVCSSVVIPSPEFQSDAKVNSDPFQLLAKEEPGEKEQPAVYAVLRKPTVIRISGKLGKSTEELQIPPALPVEDPVGSHYNKSTARPRPVGRKQEWEQTDSTEDTRPKPVLPTRPVGVKVMETNQPPPPQKGPPGRPPPPKVSKPSSHRDGFPRSSSDVGLSAKHNTSGISRSKSQVVKRQQPELPPRPKPGHPLYSKYTLPLPHGIAERDVVSNNPGELSCKRGEVLVLLEQTDSNYMQCQKGAATGELRISNLKIITPIKDTVDNRHKELNHGTPDIHVPHALVLHDFMGEHDDLSLTSGETVYLLEKIENDWYKGKCQGRTGMFPANHVRVVVDIPDKAKPKLPSSTSNAKGPHCLARFEFIGDQKDELSFSEGDIITLKEYINDEWARGELRGQTGIFPINFIEILEDVPARASNLTSDAVSSQKNRLSEPNAEQSHIPGDWYEALYDFAAESDEDLAFKKGDKILIIERIDAEWYKGRLNEKEGILPSAFIQLSSGLKQPPTQGGKTGRARALFDFCGETVDELTFKVGDIISSVETIDNEWMSGELCGKSGIFPKNFVQRL